MQVAEEWRITYRNLIMQLEHPSFFRDGLASRMDAQVRP